MNGETLYNSIPDKPDQTKPVPFNQLQTGVQDIYNQAATEIKKEANK